MDSKKDQEGNTKQEETMETKQQKEARNTEEFNLSQKLEIFRKKNICMGANIVTEEDYKQFERDLKEFIRLLKKAIREVDIYSIDEDYEGNKYTTIDVYNIGIIINKLAGDRLI